MRPSFSKYKAVRTEYNGITYASKAEAAFAQQLDLDPEIEWWLPQIPIQLTPDDRYRVDFVVCALRLVYAVDVKGMATAAFNRNKRLWKRYGPFPLHVVRNGKTVEVIEPTKGA